jgi:hypothetical protein
VTGFVSLTPNAYVVGIEEDGVLLVHQLGTGRANPVPPEHAGDTAMNAGGVRGTPKRCPDE